MDVGQEAKPVTDKQIAGDICQRSNAKDGAGGPARAAPEDDPSKWQGWGENAAGTQDKMGELHRSGRGVREEGGGVGGRGPEGRWQDGGGREGWPGPRAAGKGES